MAGRHRRRRRSALGVLTSRHAAALSYDAVVTSGGASRWVRDAGALWRRTPNAVVVLADGTREPFTLTGSGRALWEALGDPLDEAELCHRLAERYGTDEVVVADDVRRVITDLDRRGALHHQP